MIERNKVEQLSIYNLDYLKLMSDGDNGFVLDILQTLLKNCPSEVSLIESYYQSGNMKALSTTLHKLKSTMHILGNEKLNLLVEDLEIKTAEGTLKESIYNDLETLKASIKVLIDKLLIEVTKIN